MLNPFHHRLRRIVEKQEKPLIITNYYKLPQRRNLDVDSEEPPCTSHSSADGSRTRTVPYGLCSAILLLVPYTGEFKHLQAHVAATAFDSDDNADAPNAIPRYPRRFWAVL